MPSPNPQNTPWEREVVKWESVGYSLREAVQEASKRWPDTRDVTFFLYNRGARTAFTKFAKEMIRRKLAIDYQYRSRAEMKGEGVEFPDPRGILTMASRQAPVDWARWQQLAEQHDAHEDAYDDDYEEAPGQKEQDNPEWTLDGEKVETDYGAKGWEYRFRGQTHGPFPTEGEAVREAMQKVARADTPVAIIGDWNPIDYDGGIIYRRGHPPKYRVVYFQGYESNGDDRVQVYRFDIAKDALDDLDWVDWQDLAYNFGEGEKTLRRQARSADVETRARVYEAVGNFHGFVELDHYPEDMTREEAQKEWGADVERVHRTPSKPNPQPRTPRQRRAARRAWMRRMLRSI